MGSLTLIYFHSFRRHSLLLGMLAGGLLLINGACASRPKPTEVSEPRPPMALGTESAEPRLCPSIETVPETRPQEWEEEGTTEQLQPESEPKSGAPDIPVIEPKKLEPRKAYEEPTIRVQILRDTLAITLRSEKEVALVFGSNMMRLEPGSPIQLKARSARVSVRTYPVGIATFSGNEYDEAVAFAEKWKKEGYTVQIIKAGGPLLQANGTVTDTTVYWVALGSFKEKQAAEAFKQKMLARGISCWVIDESVIDPRGNIELVDASGTPRAYADSRVVLTSEAPIRISDVPFGTGFWSSGKCEDRSYSGPIEILVDKQGRLSAINEVGLEKYVEGIVPVEIRLTAPDEALKAQAVAARTEALAKLGIQHVFDPYDFCATQHCQEFGGLTRNTPRTDAAVRGTRGQVLMSGGNLVDAVYSANCGGHTENNENVWSSRPHGALRGVSDLCGNPDSFRFPISSSQLSEWLKETPRAYCGDPRVGDLEKFRWKVRYRTERMTEIVNRHHRVGTVRDIKVLRRGVSGRALQVKIIGSQDSVIITKELEIRRVLGGLKSSMFVVDVNHSSSGDTTSFTFSGGGWGHGVGMCQAGAEGMALRGFTYDEIIAHYYCGAEIKQLYE